MSGQYQPADLRKGPSQAGRAPFDCSVVISLFNKGPYIERALQSILLQTVPVREIIVVDGGSTDDGIEKVARLAEREPVIRLIRQIDNGVSEGRNRGIAEAKTKWVSFLDGDDAYLPWYIEEMAALERLCPPAIFLGGRCRELAPDFDLGAATSKEAGGPGDRSVVAHFYDKWWHGNIFYTSSLCARRDALNRFPEPFPVGEHLGEDLELFFQLAERGRLAATSKISAIYAMGVPDGLTDRGRERDVLPCFQRLRARTRKADFPAAELPGARRCLATKWLTIARTRLRNGDAAGAFELMRDPITAYRPIYWIRTAGLVAVAIVTRAINGAAPQQPSPSNEKGH